MERMDEEAAGMNRDSAYFQEFGRLIRGNYLPEDRRLRFWFGVDLGKSKNYTAMAAIERRWRMATPEEFQASAGLGYHGEWEYRVFYLGRVALGTSYVDIAEWVKDEVELKYAAGMPEPTLVIDGTGVGSAVVDYLRMRNVKAHIVNTVITGGQGPGHRTEAKAVYVPRSEIMNSLRMAVERRRLKVDLSGPTTAVKCDRAQMLQVLQRELKGIQMAGKDGCPEGNDDLAFSLALAVWWGLRER
jgi:hypothetical protein